MIIFSNFSNPTDIIGTNPAGAGGSGALNGLAASVPAVRMFVPSQG
jgi:hypothetical protein